jgi:hypothetical protein
MSISSFIFIDWSKSLMMRISWMDTCINADYVQKIRMQLLQCIRLIVHSQTN